MTASFSDGSSHVILESEEVCQVEARTKRGIPAAWSVLRLLEQSRGPSARLNPTAAILERVIVLADPTIGLSVFHSSPNHGSRATSLQSAVPAQESVGVQGFFFGIKQPRSCQRSPTQLALCAKQPNNPRLPSTMDGMCR